MEWTTIYHRGVINNNKEECNLEERKEETDCEEKKKENVELKYNRPITYLKRRLEKHQYKINARDWGTKNLISLDQILPNIDIEDNGSITFEIKVTQPMRGKLEPLNFHSKNNTASIISLRKEWLHWAENFEARKLEYLLLYAHYLEKCLLLNNNKYIRKSTEQLKNVEDLSPYVFEGLKRQIENLNVEIKTRQEKLDQAQALLGDIWCEMGWLHQGKLAIRENQPEGRCLYPTPNHKCGDVNNVWFCNTSGIVKYIAVQYELISNDDEKKQDQENTKYHLLNNFADSIEPIIVKWKCIKMIVETIDFIRASTTTFDFEFVNEFEKAWVEEDTIDEILRFQKDSKEEAEAIMSFMQSRYSGDEYSFRAPAKSKLNGSQIRGHCVHRIAHWQSLIKTSFECNICCNQVPAKFTLVDSKYENKCCKACLATHFKNEFNYANDRKPLVKGLRCPLIVYGCCKTKAKCDIICHCKHDSVVDEESVKSLFPDEFEALYLKLQGKRVSVSRTLWWCQSKFCADELKIVPTIDLDSKHGNRCNRCNWAICVRCGAKQHKGKKCNALSPEQLSQVLENGRQYQCPKCSFGPVEHGNCEDLSSHHGETVGENGKISNACPKCNFLGDHISEWVKWDGTLQYI